MQEKRPLHRHRKGFSFLKQVLLEQVLVFASLVEQALHRRRALSSFLQLEKVAKQIFQAILE